MKKILPFLFFASLASIPGCSGPPVRIEGQVTHLGTGKGIPGAYIVEEDADTFYTADSLGYYVIPEAKSRRHIIAFGAEGFEPVKVEFKASSDDSVYILNVSLHPRPFEVMY
ncbi:hypothetical protein JXM67_13765 [candidate division WOR-3 bacterium]|nr:hypothetical protein [candidate division WOR-3 bacterium]